MKKKIIGIFICTILITTILPVVGMTNTKDITNVEESQIPSYNRLVVKVPS